MHRREQTSDKLRYAALWMAAGALEFPLLALLLWGEPMVSWAALLSAHALASACMFFAPPKAGGWLSPLRHWGEPSALWTFFMPGVGWLIVGALCIVHWNSEDPKDFFQSEDFAPKEEPLLTLGNEITSTIEERLFDAVDVLPATDILLGPDPTLKRSAIETLAKIRTPEAISWILKSRRDQSADVRFFATATLTQLKRDFEQQLRAAKREIYEKPMERAQQLALQHIAYEYALSGLLDPDSKAELLESCRENLGKLSAEDTDALRLLFETEKILDAERALALLPALNERLPGDERRWLREKARLQFRLLRIPAVIETMRRLAAAEAGAPEPVAQEAQRRADLDWKSSMHWWTGG